MKNTNNSTKNNKPKIDGIVVVEGKTDTAKLQKLFDVQTIETNGLNISKNTINLLKNVAKTNKLILFLDPDGPGEKIRRIIIDNIDNCYNIFIEKKDIDFHNNSKIGIAEAYDNVILKAFNNLVYFDKSKNSISWEQYLNLNLNTKQKRKKVTNYFKISECNNKQLFKRLNMMNISYEEIRKVIDDE